MRQHHKQPGKEPAPSLSDPIGSTGQSILSSLQELREVQEKKIEQSMQDLGGQNAFLRQQVGQLNDAVRQLYGAVSAQCVQLRDSETALQVELRKFQIAGPHIAMTGLFHKLFRDLLKQMNQMDDLVSLSEQGVHSDAEKSWMGAIRVARDSFESILLEWGCSPLDIQVSQELFDPEIHEAVPGDGYAEVPSYDGNRVLKVVRRGWRLSGTLVQHPQVIVG